MKMLKFSCEKETNRLTFNHSKKEKNAIFSTVFLFLPDFFKLKKKVLSKMKFIVMSAAEIFAKIFRFLYIAKRELEKA